MLVMNLIEREQLAAQVVAVMDAHFARPAADEKQDILDRAAGQVRAAEALAGRLELLQNLDNAASQHCKSGHDSAAAAQVASAAVRSPSF